MIDGGGGIDTASYASATGGVFVNLTGGFASGAARQRHADQHRECDRLGVQRRQLQRQCRRQCPRAASDGHDFTPRPGRQRHAASAATATISSTAANGDDILNGGGGFDRAAYSTGAVAGVTVNLNIDGVAQNTGRRASTR